MELRELRLIVGRHLLIAVLVFAAVLAVGASASLLPEKTYRTSATVLVNVGTTNADGTSIQQVEFLLPALREAAESRSLRVRAEEQVPEEYRVSRPGVEAISDDSVLRIRGTADSPEAAQAWVNAIADQLVEEQLGEGSVELVVLDPAPLKSTPIDPKVAPIMLATVVVGLIAALFAALAAERIKVSLDTRHAVRERLGTTVLGEIPALRRRTEQRVAIIDLMNGAQQSEDVISAFEALRTNVEFRMADLGADSVCVVSLERHAGKSTVAAGLSCALVKVGRRVVAIEADLRRPTLSAQLNVSPQYGLGDISAAGGTGDLILQSTRLPGLELLPAGLPVGRAADVISTTLPSVITALAEPGRTLVIDSPPFAGAPESAVIVAQCRFVILVINNRNHDLDALSDSVARINESGGALLGIVINRVPRRRLRKAVYPAFDDRVHVDGDATPTAVPASWSD